MWAALAVLLAVPPLAIGQTRAENSATVPTNPPGVEHAAPSSSTDIRKIPTHAEAIAALMAPDDPNPALGQESPQALEQRFKSANRGSEKRER